MNVLVANLAGVKVEADGSVKHYIKAGSRWPMTISPTLRRSSSETQRPASKVWTALSWT
jgi:hypothetical protein